MHEERNLYADLVTGLSTRLSDAEILCKQREKDNAKLVSDNDALRSQAAHLASLIPAHTQQRLHVVGHARSGTTVIMDILNSSDEVFIFSEINMHVICEFPEIFHGYGGIGFVEHFLNRKRREAPHGKILSKGACPPSVSSSFNTVDQYVDAAGKSYRYFGDKIATHYRHVEGVDNFGLLRKFLIDQGDLGAIIFFTLRRPSIQLKSYLKMFPDADKKMLGASLAKFNVLFFEIFLRRNNSYFIFHEDISPALISELSNLLDINCSISPDLVGSEHQTKYDEEPCEAWLTELDSAYDALRVIYSCDNGALKHSKTDGLLRKLAPIVNQLENVEEGLADAANSN